MHKTFEGAYSVYCSVGDRAADSAWLCATVRYSKDLLKERGTVRLPYPEEPHMAKIQDLLGTTTAAQRFIAAWNNFCAKPYWNRLWILQEVEFGHRREIWYGRSIVDFESLEIMYSHLYEPRKDDEQDIHPLGNVCYFSSLANKDKGFVRSTPPLREEKFFTILCSKQCSDPRDLFYGSLSITELPIIPDYRKSVYEVAFEAILSLVTSNRYGYEDFDYLSLSGYREDILRVLRRMQITADAEMQGNDRTGGRHLQAGWDQHSATEPRYLALKYIGTISQLRTNNTNRFYVDADEIIEPGSGKFIMQFEDPHGSRYKGQGVGDIFSRDGLQTGVICPEACAGDLLIPFGVFEDVGWKRHLVVGWLKC